MTEEKSLVKGALLMSIGFILVACYGALLKIGGDHSSILFMSWVAIMTALVIQFVCMIPKGFSAFKTQHIVKHFFRGLFGGLAAVLYSISLGHLLLMNATLLFNTTPLFIPILALIFLHQKISWKVWVSIFVGFIGVIFIIKPTAQIIDKPWSLIGLGSGIALAIAFIFVKLLTSTEPMMRIVFYFFFFAGILLSCLSPFFWEAAPLSSWLIGIAAGVNLLLMQLLVVKAYEITDASSTGPFQYVSVLIAGLFDWLIWSQIPTLNEYIGAVLVILGGILVIAHSKKSTGKI